MKEKVFDFLIITLATIGTGAAVFFFLLPSHVSVGSISALAMVVSNFVPLSVSAITMIMNIALLVAGFLLIGKDFPNNASLTNDPFLDMLGYIFFSGITISILFIRNASSGGLDIVAKIMNKFLRMELGKAMSLAGMCVALSSALVYDKKIVVLSVLGTYFSGLLMDHFIFGSTIKKRVCIISKKEKEIREFILHELHSGATMYDAIGAYDEQHHREIITIVDKNEYMKLMNFITKTDAEAFVTVYAVNEIIYRPKV